MEAEFLQTEFTTTPIIHQGPSQPETTLHHLPTYFFLTYADTVHSDLSIY